MASKKTTALPKRFQPLLRQAQTETDLQYGPQESALQSILNDTANQYSQNLAATDTAAREMKGLLGAAPGQITQAYNDAGLTPSLLAQIGNSPTGQRIASELAANQAAIVQQQTGAQAGADYQRQHLGDQFRQDVGKIQDQSTALAKARGEYASSLLDQLISSDRSARHDANQQIRQQAFQAQQNAAQNATTTANALIGQGFQPKINPDGSVTIGGPIPGGKADPNSPQNKAKKKSPWLPQASQNSAQTEISKAVAQAKKLKNAGRSRADAAGLLTTGRPTQTVTDPKTGTVVTVQGIPSFDDVIASTALDIAYDGHISRNNVARLHTKKIKVGDLGYPTPGTYVAPAPPPPRPQTGAPRLSNDPFGRQFGNPLGG